MDLHSTRSRPTGDDAQVALPLIPERDKLAQLRFKSAAELRDCLVSWQIAETTLSPAEHDRLDFVNRPDIGLCYKQDNEIGITMMGIDLLLEARKGSFVPSSIRPDAATLAMARERLEGGREFP